MRTRIDLSAILIAVICGFSLPVFGQAMATDTQNVMTPAAGAMAGVSAAMPQDVPAAVFGNPSTLSQFQGTQFTLGGGWVEGYPTVTFDGPGGPVSVTSRTEGFAVPTIGVTQDLRARACPEPWDSVSPA